MFRTSFVCLFVSSLKKLAVDRDTVQAMAFSQACSSSCLLSRGTECHQMQQFCSITRPSSLARHGMKLRCNSVWTHLSSSCRNSTGPCSADHSSSKLESKFGRSVSRRQRVQRCATGGGNGQGKDDLENYVEVKIESVRVSQGRSQCVCNASSHLTSAEGASYMLSARCCSCAGCCAQAVDVQLERLKCVQLFLGFHFAYKPSLLTHSCFLQALAWCTCG
jgi:hypothetical protein